MRQWTSSLWVVLGLMACSQSAEAPKVGTVPAVGDFDVVTLDMGVVGYTDDEIAWHTFSMRNEDYFEITVSTPVVLVPDEEDDTPVADTDVADTDAADTDATADPTADPAPTSTGPASGLALIEFEALDERTIGVRDTTAWRVRVRPTDDKFQWASQQYEVLVQFDYEGFLKLGDDGTPVTQTKNQTLDDGTKVKVTAPNPKFHATGQRFLRVLFRLDCDFDNDGYDSQSCTTSGDCNDLQALVNDEAEEVCDLIDNNCDGLIDRVPTTDVDGVAIEPLDCSGLGVGVDTGITGG